MNSRSSTDWASSTKRNVCWTTSTAASPPKSIERLDLTLEHALAAGRLDPRHRDPFDRLLIAQALVEDIELVSNEKLFNSFGVRRLWDA